MSSHEPHPATTVVFTDGACAGNPGRGGWAWAVSPGGEPCGSGNQRMELQAVLEALRALPGVLTIVSDSTYVVHCFRDRWWVKWKANGWKNSQKQPVANTDIWMPLVELVQQRQPTFRWVKGHIGDPMNDLVDRLAVVASAGPFDVAEPRGPSAQPAQTSLFD